MPLPPDDLDRVFRQHYGPLVRRLRALTGDASLAEDVAQEAFARLLEHRQRLRDPAAAERWLWTVARRLAARLASRSRLPTLPDDLAAPEDWAEEVESRVERCALRAALARAWARLPAGDRRLLWLRYGRCLDRRRLAAALGLGEECVKKRLQRALDRLRRLLASRR